MLGSATPSLESWHHAVRGEYHVGGDAAAGVRAADAGGRHDRSARSTSAAARRSGAISRQLQPAIAAALADEGQVILLLNRRGLLHAHPMSGLRHMVMRCPHCDIALTHHRTEDIALCHYCDYQMPAPADCPQCDFAGHPLPGPGHAAAGGRGAAAVSQRACLRMDTDAMQAPGSHERALAAFARARSASCWARR